MDARVTSAPAEPVVIDGGDRTCIALLLEVRDRMSDLAAGTVIHVIASDPAAPIDLPAWCYLTGHDYLGSVRAATPTYALRIAAAPAATGPASPWRRA
jgi:tRNA 2-thiouridine synthesizing protein A